jgi:hypothetical protein
MFNSLSRVLPSRVSDYLTTSYFTGGLESDDHAWANEKLLRTTKDYLYVRIEKIITSEVHVDGIYRHNTP